MVRRCFRNAGFSRGVRLSVGAEMQGVVLCVDDFDVSSKKGPECPIHGTIRRQVAGVPAPSRQQSISIMLTKPAMKIATPASRSAAKPIKAATKNHANAATGIRTAIA